jgi:hypothetical protein
MAVSQLAMLLQMIGLICASHCLLALLHSITVLAALGLGVPGPHWACFLI